MTQELFTDLSKVIVLLEDGRLIWGSQHKLAGKEAGKVNKDGYRSFGFRRRTILAHRFIWWLSHDSMPGSQIDHIDGNKINNRPSNLRLADHSQNQQNAKCRSKTGYKGVAFLGPCRFQAQIGKNYLGTFKSAIEAALAYDSEAIKRYGAFARTNFKEAA